MKKKVVSKLSKVSQKKVKTQVTQQPLFGLKTDRYINEPKKLTQVNQNKLKLVHWNVNGLRAILKKGVLDHYFNNFDIICLSETKIDLQKLKQEGVQLNNLWYGKFNQYWSFSTAKKGYSGCVVFTKIRPLKVQYGIGQKKFDCEGRFNVIEYKDFYLVNVYVPNSKRGLLRLNERVEEFDVEFRKFLNELKQKKMLIVVGDMNVAHQEIDIADPKNNKKSAGFTDQERESFTKLLDKGFIDIWRKTHQDVVQYSWWSNLSKHKSRAERKGWRIDYCLVDDKNEKHIDKTEIRDDVMGSDHCPMEVYLKFDKTKSKEELDKTKEVQQNNDKDDNQGDNNTNKDNNNQQDNNNNENNIQNNNNQQNEKNNNKTQNSNQTKQQNTNFQKNLLQSSNKTVIDVSRNFKSNVMNIEQEEDKNQTNLNKENTIQNNSAPQQVNNNELNNQDTKSLEEYKKIEQQQKLQGKESQQVYNSITFKNFQSEQNNKVSENMSDNNDRNSNQNQKRYSDNFQTDKAYHRKKFSFQKKDNTEQHPQNIEQIQFKNQLIHLILSNLEIFYVYFIKSYFIFNEFLLIYFQFQNLFFQIFYIFFPFKKCKFHKLI